VVCVFGILLVAQPTFLFGFKDRSSTRRYPTVIGVTMLALAAFLSSGTIYLTRALNGRAPQTLLHGYMSVLATEGLLVMIFFDHHSQMPGTVGQWMLALGYALSGLVGQYLSVAGFKYENMSVGSVLANMEMAFACLIDVVLIHEPLSWVSIFGAVVIFAGGGIVALKSQSSSSTTAKRLIITPMEIKGQQIRFVSQ
jgi:drug/metabolite transporter (DMT)-like permease